MRLLEGFRLNPRKSFAGRVRGERLTRKKGVSIEFADYRDYSQGDDLRHLDWNVLARLDAAVVRTYRDEEDLAVYVLLDGSPSMEYGEPTKLDLAKQLALAVGFIGLVGGDAVTTVPLGMRLREGRVLRGRVSVSRLHGTRASLSAAPGGESLSAGLRRFASSAARPGVAVLISDLLDPEAPAAIRAVAGRGHELLVLQVLATMELDPDLEGDLRLIDGEGGRPVEITANGPVLREYRKRLLAHNASLKDAVLRSGGRYAQVLTDRPFESVVTEVFKREGWVT